MIGAAIFSEDGLYRYELTREGLQPEFGEADSTLMFVMLNPSTADAEFNDPTLRRCLGFTQKWGYSKLVVCNLFALRATNPINLVDIEDPVGPLNDETIARNAADSYTNIVCAWGALGVYRKRDERVLRLLQEHNQHTYCLALTKAGLPRHPLYLRGECELIPFGRA